MSETTNQEVSSEIREIIIYEPNIEPLKTLDVAVSPEILEIFGRLENRDVISLMFVLGGATNDPNVRDDCDSPIVRDTDKTEIHCVDGLYEVYNPNYVGLFSDEDERPDSNDPLGLMFLQVRPLSFDENKHIVPWYITQDGYVRDIELCETTDGKNIGKVTAVSFVNRKCCSVSMCMPQYLERLHIDSIIQVFFELGDPSIDSHIADLNILQEQNSCDIELFPTYRRYYVVVDCEHVADVMFYFVEFVDNSQIINWCIRSDGYVSQIEDHTLGTRLIGNITSMFIIGD